MENIKNDSYTKDKSRNSDQSLDTIKVYMFSLIGIIIFFIPIEVNNQINTILYHISYFIENKISNIINTSIIFFITLSILKNVINVEKSDINKVLIFTKTFSLIILIFLFIGQEEMFFIDDSFILILKDLIVNLSIVFPIASLFMPFLLDYGLVEITEAFTNKFMKSFFKVSGKVFLNFLVYLLVNNVCGAFVTYILYKDGKLREKECAITILNFSVLSISLTTDLCYTIDINLKKFLIMEVLFLIICNIIITRIYPLNKKKQSYYFKSGHKNINCNKNRLNTAIKRYYENKKDKKLISLSLSYLNDSIAILMELIPIIVLIFFVGNIIYNIEIIMDAINFMIYEIVEKFNIPDSRSISNIISLNFFNSILATENINKQIYNTSKIMIGLLISTQCINISFLIPFINKFTLNISMSEIILVAIERLLIMIFVLLISYNFYLGYIIN